MPGFKLTKTGVAVHHRVDQDDLRSICSNFRDDLDWGSQDVEDPGTPPSRWEPRRSALGAMMQRPAKEDELGAHVRLNRIKEACGKHPAPIDSWGRSFVGTVEGWRQLSRRSLSWTQVKEHRKGYG
jgi:hypothetical protein